MLKLLRISMVFLVCCAVLFPAFSKPLENLATLKKALIHYHDSGQYYQDVAKVVKEARDYMQFRLIQNQRAYHPQKLAMVMDIDETVLSRYPGLVKLNFGGMSKEIDAQEKRAEEKAIPYTRTLYNFAREHGVAVFFITNRREHLRKATIENLAKAGFRDYKALYLRSEDDNKASVVPYRTAMRRKIEKAGYDIIVNIGDQESDLKGSYADMSFKIPNPFYQVS